MALNDPYVTAAQLKTRLGISDSTDDTAITAAVNASSRWIDNFCNRRRFGFNVATAATARTYRPLTLYRCMVDDISSNTSLVVKVDQGGDGTYETTWTNGTHFLLEPLDEVAADGGSRPYTSLTAIDSSSFPMLARRRPAVQVTALWGWPAVPALVTEACYQLAEETFKLKDAPFGVAGVNDFGVLRIGNQTMNRVQAMLQDYIRGTGGVLVG